MKSGVVKYSMSCNLMTHILDNSHKNPARSNQFYYSLELETLVVL